AGIGSVLILHRLVRKWMGELAAHLAALALAVTPVAALMFRFNNPDGVLTFLLLASAWALWAAIESGRTRHLVVSAVLMGFAFNTKMLQAFVVLPVFILVYLWAGPPKLGRRIVQLAYAAAALIVSAGWWVAIVALWPAASRPYVGSTNNNSILSLVFGYNGLSRIFGNGQGAPGGGAGPGGAGGPGGGGGFGGSPGWLRMFNNAVGGQISWLLPLALAGLAAGIWLTLRNRRTDTGRAGWLLWGGWTLITLAVFSQAQGVFHQYYTVALAPGVAALAGGGAVALWRLGRTQKWLGWALPAAIAVTAWWAVTLLHRTPTYVPWLRTAIVVGATLAVAGFVVAASYRHRLTVTVAAVVAGATLLAGPVAYTLTTVRNPAGGSLAAAGPSTISGPGGRGGPGEATTVDAGLISYLESHRNGAQYVVAAFGSQSSASVIIATGQPVITIGGFNGGDPAPTLAQFQKLVADGKVRYILLSDQGGPGGGGFPGGGFTPPAGFAPPGGNGLPGGNGFPGGGPGGPGGGGPNGSGTSQAIRTWVTEHGTQVAASEYGGTGTSTLYALS
ncbi:MAG: glycosyltransferase family 39 protein, partial [Actinobacteria bacterium]|nr:glycosyltransferase family 39 protein [Actinomycetota bacterium]